MDVTRTGVDERLSGMPLPPALQSRPVTRSWIVVVTTYLVFALVPLVILGAVVYGQRIDYTGELALARRDDQVRAVVQLLDVRVSDTRRLVTTTTRRLLLIEALKEGQASEAQRIAVEVKQMDDHLERVIITDASGAVIATDDDHRSLLGTAVSDLDWFAGVAASREPYISDIFARPGDSRERTFVIAAPVRDGVQIVGYLAVFPGEDYIPSAVNVLELAGSEELIVTDLNGELVYGSDGGVAIGMDMTGRPGVALAIDRQSGARRIRSSSHDEYVGYAPVGVARLAVVSAQTAEGVLGPVRASIPAFGVAFVVIAALALVGSYLNLRLARTAESHAHALAQANADLESFSYSVSHDLRAPLRAIEGFSVMLLEDYSDSLDDEGRRLLGVIRANTSKMGQLIEDLLAFSRAGRAEISKSRVDVSDLARSALVDLGPAHRDHDVRIEIGDVPEAFADRSLLKQVLVNYLANGIKFTSKTADALVELGGTCDGAECVWWVRDNGAGFDPQYAARLFGVFQRLHRADEFEGTGVGLAICRRIIGRHGGRVWATGAPGEGATFYFSLPRDR
ncbi:MAG: sensor histidine kinase [Coriobacteriia bacterium]